MRARRWPVAVLSVLVGASALAAAPSVAARTVTFASGIGGAAVDASLDGEAWFPALPVALDPPPAWDTIPGTSWIGHGPTGGRFMAMYRVAFTLPVDFNSARLSVDLHADDRAHVMLNGTFVGSQPAGAGAANYQDAPETFTATQGFFVGTNVLWFQVEDAERVHGLDFVATLTYQSNGPPVVATDGPYTVAEGAAVRLSGVASDPDLDPLVEAWDLDGDGIFETNGGTASFSAANVDGPAIRPVAFRACDPRGACATAETTVSVLNAAPAASLSLPVAALDGALTLRLVDVSDPSAADASRLAFAFDCGDGTGPRDTGGVAWVTCPPGPVGPRSVGGWVRDDDGATSAYTATTVVYGATDGGAFVIGDGSATGQVTFSSPQWARNNVLSGGRSPANFKGFVPGATAGACSGTWSAATRPAPRAPDAVPAYIAVIVTSSVDETKSAASGPVAGVVVVRTDGSASGAGWVVATIC